MNGKIFLILLNKLLINEMLTKAKKNYLSEMKSIYSSTFDFIEKKERFEIIRR
jgi:hypothetical protein